MTENISLYNFIFFSNVLRILREQGMTKNDLHDRSGVSISFLSDLTTGKGNPSLKVMEAIARALNTPLPYLLESCDLDPATLDELAGGQMPSSVPPGFLRVTAILPEFQAYQVRQWATQAAKKMKK